MTLFESGPVIMKKSRTHGGRPSVSQDVRELTRTAKNVPAIRKGRGLCRPSLAGRAIETGAPTVLPLS